MTKSRRISLLAYGLISILSASTSLAQVVEEIDDVNGLGSGFREVSTGLTWLDYSNFSGMRFSSIKESLIGTGFRLASKSEVQRLLGALQSTNSIVGVVVPQLMNSSVQRGFFDDSSTGSDEERPGGAELTGGNNTIPPVVADDGFDANIVGAVGAWVVQQVAETCEDGALSIDFDCDGKDDKVVWREATGTWFVNLSSSNSVVVEQWGLPGDVPISGDYDGDGVPDFAVWRPESATWFIKSSIADFSATSPIVLQFGLPGDLPLRNDFDGDGRLDVSVWRPSSGEFFYVRSIDATVVVKQFGLNGDIPITALR